MRTRLLLLVAAGLLTACSKPVAFQGKSTLPIVGTPPAPVAEAPPPPPRVEVRDNKIEIHEKIQFDHNASTIKEASFGLMGEIAAVITKNPQIRKIQIEGHASSEGNAAHNKRLSDARAKSVMKWLVEHGVAADRLAAIGYGIEKPIADNATDAGREQNRRVEFAILEQDITKKKVEIGNDGSEKVVEETKETIKATPASMPAASNAKPEPKSATATRSQGVAQ